MNKLSMNFDHSEAKGVVTMEEGAYGAWILVNGICVAMIDLFYFSEYGNDNSEGQEYPQIVIYNGDDLDDPACHVMILKDGVKVRVEREHKTMLEYGRNLIVDIPRRDS